MSLLPSFPTVSSWGLSCFVLPSPLCLLGLLSRPLRVRHSVPAIAGYSVAPSDSCSLDPRTLSRVQHLGNFQLSSQEKNVFVQKHDEEKDIFSAYLKGIKHEHLVSSGDWDPNLRFCGVWTLF